VKYVAPYGVSDPDASYVNGDPSIGQQGSIPPAAVFENPQRELVTLISKSGLTPEDDDLSQVAQSVRSQWLNYVEDTGSASNLIVALDPPLTSYSKGLPLRVKIRATNTGPSRINAGAGTVPIHKMNGADVGPGELPVGAVATLIFDGAAFQLSNFGGGGGTGAGDVFVVNIPYTVDSSFTPGTITANFTPPITAMTAGDIVAVKVAQTAPGPTRMTINGLAPIDLLPNGGGPMLQGDIVANDVVQFFYDGVNLRFPPNPEINATVIYNVGAGQQFATVDDALNALKRKTIGGHGYVTLKMTAGVFGPVTVSHPSGDRLKICGTMIGAPPNWSDFAASGNSAQARSQDAIYNINMLRTRFGTEIRVPPATSAGNTYGLSNIGAGSVTFADLLVTGNQPPASPPYWQVGLQVNVGTSCIVQDVSCWGLFSAVVINGGGLSAQKLYDSASTQAGTYVNGGSASLNDCGSFGGGGGYYVAFGSLFGSYLRSLMHAGDGFWAYNTAAIHLYYTSALGSACDLAASTVASIIVRVPGSSWSTTTPALAVVGNYGAVVQSMALPAGTSATAAEHIGASRLAQMLQRPDDASPSPDASPPSPPRPSPKPTPAKARKPPAKK
jgi:hypothetical protein